MTEGTPVLPTVRVHAIDPEPDEARWLVQDLWGASAVGVIGGAAKSCKSWLGLDLAVSGTACLGRFEVLTPGPTLVYLAEDALPRVRDRVAQICEHRGLSLPDLDLHVVTAPSLRLDVERDRRALDATLSAIRPKLLVLDPLVRLHRLDENSAADVSGRSASCASSTADTTSPSSSSTTHGQALSPRPRSGAPGQLRPVRLDRLRLLPRPSR